MRSRCGARCSSASTIACSGSRPGQAPTRCALRAISFLLAPHRAGGLRHAPELVDLRLLGDHPLLGHLRGRREPALRADREVLERVERARLLDPPPQLLLVLEPGPL